ncbi:hypothetical protein PVAP13_1KG065700 [Panicum virgatum]|uniref:Uncharacterized protein n=1 Tax=Panicum virgatum TaxID=38727 RepID=A0A8T0XE68_PANVG|nr:hypothetical protein PVAP13_1KG065700 [Panicum virgatum]
MPPWTPPPCSYLASSGRHSSAPSVSPRPPCLTDRKYTHLGAGKLIVGRNATASRKLRSDRGNCVAETSGLLSHGPEPSRHGWGIPSPTLSTSPPHVAAHKYRALRASSHNLTSSHRSERTTPGFQIQIALLATLGDPSPASRYGDPLPRPLAPSPRSAWFGGSAWSVARN